MNLIDLVKQAKELNDKFMAEQEAKLKADVNNIASGISEDEQIEILEQLHLADFDDLDDAYPMSGHYDEQALFNYRYAQDEDGEWLHPYDRED